MNKILSTDELANANYVTLRAVRVDSGKGLFEPMRVGRILCFSEDTTVAFNHKRGTKWFECSLAQIKTALSGHIDSGFRGDTDRFWHSIFAAIIEVTGLPPRLSQTPNGSRKKERVP